MAENQNFQFYPKKLNMTKGLGFPKSPPQNPEANLKYPPNLSSTPVGRINCKLRNQNNTIKSQNKSVN